MIAFLLLYKSCEKMGFEGAASIGQCISQSQFMFFPHKRTKMDTRRSGEFLPRRSLVRACHGKAQGHDCFGSLVYGLLAVMSLTGAGGLWR